MILSFLCGGVLMISLPSLVWSQPKATKKRLLKTNKKPTKADSSSSKVPPSDQEEDLSQTQPGKVIEFSQFTIEGTIPRPSAAYLLQRRKLKFRGLTPKKSFLPALFKSVERSPF